MPEESLQLQDPLPIHDLLPEPGWPWWAWTLLAVGVVLIMVVLALIIRSRKKQSASDTINPETAYRHACETIENALDASSADPAVTLSIAIRQYLADVSHDPSLYETHQEFIARHAALGDLPQPLREKTADLLTQLAEQKYNRDHSPATHDDLARDARQLLDEIHHRRPSAA